jgi:hypothetical protein
LDLVRVQEELDEDRRRFPDVTMRVVCSRGCDGVCVHIRYLVEALRREEGRS